LGGVEYAHFGTLNHKIWVRGEVIELIGKVGYVEYLLANFHSFLRETFSMIYWVLKIKI